MSQDRFRAQLFLYVRSCAYLGPANVCLVWSSIWDVAVLAFAAVVQGHVVVVVVVAADALEAVGGRR